MIIETTFEKKPIYEPGENPTDKRDFYQQIFLLMILRKHIGRNRDAFALIEQDKGFGKSTLAIQLAKKWVNIAKQYLDYKLSFDYKTHIVYDDNVDDILEKVNSLPQYSPVIFDEGARIILAENWNTKAQKKIKQLFGEIRTKHLFVIINFPFSIEDVDKKYLKSLIDYWIHIWGFGYSTIIRKNLRPLMKGFALEYLDKILPGYIGEITSKREFASLLNILNSHPGFYSPLYWIQLGKKEYELYKKYRDHAVYRRESRIEDESISDRFKKQKLKLIMELKNNDYTNEKIGKILGMSQSAISQFISRNKILTKSKI